MPNRKKLYNALKQEGYDNFKDESEFNSYVSDANNRKKLFEALKQEGYDNFENEKSFDEYLGYGEPYTHEYDEQGNLVGGTAYQTSEPYEYKPEVQQHILENKPDMFKPKTVDMYGAHDKEKSELDLMNEGRSYELSAMRAASTIGEQLNERIKANDEALKKAYAKREKPIFGGSGIGIGRAYSASSLEVGDSDEIKDLKAEQEYLSNAKKVFEAAKNDAGFFQGMKDAVDSSYLSFGMSDLQNTERIANVQQKLETGQTLSESEQSLLTSLGLRQMVNEQYNDMLGHWYKAGMTTADMLPFMVEMAVNPLSGLGKSAMKASVKKFGEKGAKAIASKMLSRTIGDVAGAAGMSATTGLPSVMADALERQQGYVTTGIEGGSIKGKGFEGGETASDAWRKAFTSRTIENWSEMVGEYFSPVGHVIGKGVKKGLDKIGLSKVTDFIDGVQSSDWTKLLDDFSEQTQWHGSLGEFAEEQVGMIADALLVGDTQWSDLVDAEKQLDVALGVGVFGTVMSMLRIGGYRTPKYRARKAVERADNAGLETFGAEQWGIVKGSIDNAESEEQMLADLSGVFGSDATEEQKKAAFSYANALKAQQAVNTVKEKQKIDEPGNVAVETESAYDAGTELQEPQEKHQAKQELDIAEAALGSLSENADEQMFAQMVMNGIDNPVETVTAMAEQGYSDEQIQKAKDYYTAYRRLDGLTDAVMDRVDAAVERADAEVDANINTQSGAVIQVILRDGSTGYVVNNTVVRGEDGSVDVDNSDDTIVVRLETGETKMMNPNKDLLAVSWMESPETLKDANHTVLRKKLLDKEIGEIDWNPATPNPKVGDSFEMDGVPVTIVSHNGKGGMFVVPTEEYQAAAGNEKKMQELVVKAQQTEAVPAKVYKDWASAQIDAQEQAESGKLQENGEQMSQPETVQEGSVETNPMDETGETVAEKKPMNEDEAATFIFQMERNAVEAPEIELTPENWIAEFGEDGLVDTPIGQVKFGQHQYMKLQRQGRNGKLGMIKPTLTNPDVIVEDSSNAKEGDTSERGTSYVFVKSFKKKDGKRVYYLTSITIKKDGSEIVVSNQEKRTKQIQSLMMRGKLLWNRFESDSDSSGENQAFSSATTENPNSGQPGSTAQSDVSLKRSEQDATRLHQSIFGEENGELVSPQSASLSDNKGNAKNVQEQGNQGDFVAMGTENALKALGGKYGEKMPRKVEVTAKAYAEDLKKAQQKLDKAEDDYDNAPIGREDKAKKARDKAREEFEAVKREADFWAQLDSEIKAAQVKPGAQSVPTGRTSRIEEESAEVDGGVAGTDGAVLEGASGSEVKKDENGKPFVTAPNGTIDFGFISSDTGLSEAPIRLVDGTKDYGKLHIEQNHGEQIRDAGFTSVEEFVAFVASNYNTIKMGNTYFDKNTYIVELTDKKNNTLFVELSSDGSYWNVNSAGVFRKGYSKNKEVIWTAPAVGHNSTTENKEVASSITGENGSSGSTSEDSSHIPSAYKGSNLSEEDKGNERNVAENEQYTIEHATYTTKRGKELDMYFVKFNQELTKGIKSAANGLAKELKGWWDRKNGGFMMRSEEDAKRLAEYVADAQSQEPVSMADLQSVNDGDVVFAEPQQLKEQPKDENPKVEGENNYRKGEGALTADEVSMANDPIGKVLGQSTRTAGERKSFAERERQRMVERVESLAKKLRLNNVEIVTDADTLSGAQRKAKGFYSRSKRKITIVIPNHSSVFDAEQTLLHEAVAHYGLRELFGTQFDVFLNNVYNNAAPEVRERINQLAMKNGWDFPKATEEYLASLAEDTNFDNVEESWWGKIKQLFLQMLHSIGFEGFTGVTLTDNELRYILWRSYENLAEPGKHRSILGEAADIAKQTQLKVGNYSREKYERERERLLNAGRTRSVVAESDEYTYTAESRSVEKSEGSLAHGGSLDGRKNENSRKEVVDKDDTLYRPADEVEGMADDTARKLYEDAVKTKKYRFQEGFQDAMLSLKKLQEAIVKQHGGKLEEWEDAYTAENQMSSRDTAEVENFTFSYFKPMMKEAANILNRARMDYESLRTYLMAKSGLERNRDFAVRDALAEREKDGEDVSGLYENYMQRKKELLQDLEDETITFREYCEAMDNEAMLIAPDKLGKDYSGLTALFGEDTFTEKAIDEVEIVEGLADTKNLWKSIKRATRFSLDRAKQSGVMSTDAHKKVSEMFEWYVPMRGWSETKASDVYEYFGGQEGVFNSTVKTAGGRTSLSDDPLATIANMAESAILQGNKNQMKQKLLNLAFDKPTNLITVMDSWIENKGTEDSPKWEYVYPPIEQDDDADVIAYKIKLFEEEMQQKKDEGRAKKLRGKADVPYIATPKEIAQHIVRVKRNGREFVMIVNGNPRAAQAINGMTNPETYNGIIERMSRQLNQFMAAAFTTRNPTFIARNLSRDLIFSNTAVAVKENVGYGNQFRRNQMKVLGNIRGLMKRYQSGKLDMDNELDKMFAEFIKNGGETGFAQLTSVDEYKKKIQRELKDAKKGGKVINGRKVGRAVLDAIEFYNRCAEDISRFTVYMTSRQMGRSIQRSVGDAKEITVNFNKRGSGSKAGGFIGFGAQSMRSMYLFFNAAVQALVNFKRLGQKHPVAFTTALTMYAVSGFLMPVVNEFLSSMLGGDDDDYDNLPEWIRRNDLVFYLGKRGGDAMFLTIPLPVEMRAFYGLGEAAYQLTAGNVRGKDAALQITGQFAEMLPLNFVTDAAGPWNAFTPDAFKPIAQAYISNKDWTGKPIYRDNGFNKELPEWTKAYAGTVKWLVDSAELMNELTGGDKYKSGVVDINPARLEHLFTGYLGGFGDMFLGAYKTASMFWHKEYRNVRNIPVLKALLNQDDERTGYAQVKKDYAAFKKEYEDTVRRLNGYDKEMKRPETAMEYAERKTFLHQSKQMKHYVVMRDYERKLSELYKLMRENPDEKAQESITNTINQVKADAVKRLRSIDER